MTTASKDLCIEALKATYDKFDGKMPDDNVSMWFGTFVDTYTEMLVKKCGEICVLGDPTYSAQHNIHQYFGVK